MISVGMKTGIEKMRYAAAYQPTSAAGTNAPRSTRSIPLVMVKVRVQVQKGKPPRMNSRNWATSALSSRGRIGRNPETFQPMAVTPIIAMPMIAV